MGIALQADVGAQVHHALRIGLDAAVRQHRFRLLPELILHPFVSRITADARVARQHTFHVAVQNGATLAEVQRANMLLGDIGESVRLAAENLNAAAAAAGV